MTRTRRCTDDDDSDDDDYSDEDDSDDYEDSDDDDSDVTTPTTMTRRSVCSGVDDEPTVLGAVEGRDDAGDGAL